jgi:hypothetical protein
MTRGEVVEARKTMRKEYRAGAILDARKATDPPRFKCLVGSI